MYKVVKKTNGKLYSAVSFGECQLEYPIGETIVSFITNSKLFCFELLSDACLFLECCQSTYPDNTYELWEVMSETPFIRPNVISIHYYDYQHVAKFWRLNSGPTRRPPKGTVWVDSLIMGRRIQ